MSNVSRAEPMIVTLQAPMTYLVRVQLLIILPGPRYLSNSESKYLSSVEGLHFRKEPDNFQIARRFPLNKINFSNLEDLKFDIRDPIQI
jgi:hypothetical protein